MDVKDVAIYINKLQDDWVEKGGFNPYILLNTSHLVLAVLEREMEKRKFEIRELVSKKEV